MSVTTVSAATTYRSVEPRCGEGVLRKGPYGLRAKPPAPVSRDAQRVAAVILEVLAGVRTPTEAAAAVSLSLPRYYLWEQRALEGLVRACEPRPKGKAASVRHQIAALEKEVVRLRQDCSRQQALVRASHRTIGLAGPPQGAAKSAAKPGGKAAGKVGVAVASKARRKRRPVVRALKAVAALQAMSSESESPADSSSAIAADPSAIAAGVVQRSVPSGSLATAEAARAAVAAVEA